MKNITPKIEDLKDFWNTYHDDQYFIWVIDFQNGRMRTPEIYRFNLN